VGRTVVLDRIPACDFPHEEEEPAVCDAQTRMGSWGYMCEGHRAQYSIGGPMPLGMHPLENPLVLRDQDAPPPGQVAQPSWDELRDMVLDGDCWATDGCAVEPDGHCQHGCPSWPIKMGIM